MTHNLGALFDLCLEVTSDLEPSRPALVPLSVHAVEARYSGNTVPSLDEARVGRDAALRLRDRILALVPEAVRPRPEDDSAAGP